MIDHIYIQDHDERYAPPEQPELEVALVGDVVFLAIGKVEQTDRHRKFEPDEGKQIGVPIEDLMNALKVLGLSQQRVDLKNLLPEADLRPTNL